MQYLSTQQVADRNNIPVSQLHHWLAIQTVWPTVPGFGQGHGHLWSYEDSLRLGIFIELHRTIHDLRIMAEAWNAIVISRPTDDVLVVVDRNVKLMRYDDLPRVNGDHVRTIVKLVGR